MSTGKWPPIDRGTVVCNVLLGNQTRAVSSHLRPEVWLFVVFFFQAEDGIRDYKVTGVQTCALPISPIAAYLILLLIGFAMIVNSAQANAMLQHLVPDELRGRIMAAYSFIVVGLSQVRSEERRVGKECRSRWSPYH